MNPWLQLLDHCEELDNTLSKLAREHSMIRFLWAKASAIGFTSGSSVAPKRSLLSLLKKHWTRLGTICEEDEKDLHGEPEHNKKDHEAKVSIWLWWWRQHQYWYMLSTLLAYWGGELIYNQMREDWEAGKGRIEELLVKWESPLLSFGSPPNVLWIQVLSSADID